MILCIFFGIKAFSALKEMQFIGSGTTATNILQVSGTGDVSAVPDIAEISFTVSHDATTMATAQKTVTDNATKAINYLKAQGIADKDIKTENYDAYPKYQWQDSQIMRPCIAGGVCPPSGQNVLTGYSASESITIKVRNVDNAGAIVTGLGAQGVTDISGPNFTIDNDEVLKTEARSKAIADAKTKADELARELGVTLIRIVNFSDNNGGGYPVPMYAKASIDSVGSSAPTPAPLPTGENKYTSNVTITYEIR
jgi:uncharacterized protein YggE